MTVPKLFVWSSPQTARVSVLQEAISLRRLKNKTFRNGFIRPLVILIAESTDAPRTHKNFESHSEPECNGRHNNRDRCNFLESWKNACFGVAEVLTILADSSSKARESFEAVVEGVDDDPSTFPLLVSVYASCDSTLTADILGFQKICAEKDIRLSIEGPGLALIAQSHRPSDPDDCAKNADVIIIDPGSWFGIKMCAIISWHNPLPQDDMQNRELESVVKRKGPWYLKEKDESHGLGAAPVINLWTVLSQIGLDNIREKVDKVTVLAETFVHSLERSPNITIAYDGISCLVRFSYALSREDRILSKEASQKHISSVNNILYANLQEEAEAVGVYRYTSERNALLQFAPAHLLSSGTFWIPDTSEIEEFAQMLQQTALKYETCRGGSSSFQARIARFRDLEMVYSDDQRPDSALSFGGVRVVPRELKKSWKKSSSKAAIISDLTAALAQELSESWTELVSQKVTLQEALQRSIAGNYSNTGKMHKTLQELISITKREEDSYEVELPFCIFLNTDLDEDAPDFLSVEPKTECSATEAMHQAQFAAELIVAAAEIVIQAWRMEKHHSPTTVESPKHTAAIPLAAVPVKGQKLSSSANIESLVTSGENSEASIHESEHESEHGNEHETEHESVANDTQEEGEDILEEPKSKESILSGSVAISEAGTEEGEDAEVAVGGADDITEELTADESEGHEVGTDAEPNNDGQSNQSPVGDVVSNTRNGPIESEIVAEDVVPIVALRKKSPSYLGCLAGKSNVQTDEDTSSQGSEDRSYDGSGDSSAAEENTNKGGSHRGERDREGDDDETSGSSSDSGNSDEDGDSRNGDEETEDESDESEDESSSEEDEEVMHGRNSRKREIEMGSIQKGEVVKGRRWMQWLRGPAPEENTEDIDSKSHKRQASTSSIGEEQSIATSVSSALETEQEGNESTCNEGETDLSDASDISSDAGGSGEENLNGVDDDIVASRAMGSSESEKSIGTTQNGSGGFGFGLGWLRGRKASEEPEAVEEAAETSASEGDFTSHAESESTAVEEKYSDEESQENGYLTQSEVENDGEGVSAPEESEGEDLIEAKQENGDVTSGTERESTSGGEATQLSDSADGLQSGADSERSVGALSSSPEVEAEPEEAQGKNQSYLSWMIPSWMSGSAPDAPVLVPEPKKKRKRVRIVEPVNLSSSDEELDCYSRRRVRRAKKKNVSAKRRSHGEKARTTSSKSRSTPRRRRR